MKIGKTSNFIKSVSYNLYFNLKGDHYLYKTSRSGNDTGVLVRKYNKELVFKTYII